MDDFETRKNRDLNVVSKNYPSARERELEARVKELESELRVYKHDHHDTSQEFDQLRAENERLRDNWNKTAAIARTAELEIERLRETLKLEGTPMARQLIETQKNERRLLDENERLRANSESKWREEAYRAQARVQELESIERLLQGRLDQELARVKELEEQRGTDRESYTATLKKVNDENERLRFDVERFKVAHDALDQEVARLQGFQTQYAVLRQENERLVEALREIDDCADDWNRVEDLAREALGEQER